NSLNGCFDEAIPHKARSFRSKVRFARETTDAYADLKISGGDHALRATVSLRLGHIAALKAI
ncbi:MAG: hypothetical protein IJD59_08100, partial [Clostridia bacterium]|nr:hypothetical protein [Clostridia bacterium]